jgi:hypothetical protein
MPPCGSLLGSAGMEPHPWVSPAIPVLGEALSTTFQVTVWLVLYHLLVAVPEKLMEGL